MNNMEIIEQLKEAKAEDVKQVFIALLQDYLTPAFGSMSKRDLDILLFMKLQELDLFPQNPDLYELVSQLRVTRSKARNLLYESKLRHTSPKELDEELKVLLQHPIFLKDQDKIGIEIDNPYLIDHLRSKLKKLNHITDGSFSPELVRLTTDAFIALFESYLPEASKKKIQKAFVEIGAEADKSFKGILKGALKKLGTKLADKAGGELAASAGDYLEPLINASVQQIKARFSTLFNEDSNSNT